MADLSRRTTLAGAAAAGLAALAGNKARADTLPSDEPVALFGTVTGDTVSLPPLHDTATDLDPPTINVEPPNKRLGIAVVGIGHLALNQILPGFGRAKSVKVTALVSGESDKARAVGAQYGVPETHLYNYGNFDRLKDNPDVDIIYIVLPNSMHAEFTVRAAAAGTPLQRIRQYVDHVRTGDGRGGLERDRAFHARIDRIGLFEKATDNALDDIAGVGIDEVQRDIIATQCDWRWLRATRVDELTGPKLHRWRHIGGGLVAGAQRNRRVARWRHTQRPARERGRRRVRLRRGRPITATSQRAGRQNQAKKPDQTVTMTK